MDAVIPPVINDPVALARSLFPKPPDTIRDNQVLVMTCTDNLEFMRGLPDGHCKLIVTSPPYNLGKDY